MMNIKPNLHLLLLSFSLLSPVAMMGQIDFDPSEIKNMIIEEPLPDKRVYKSYDFKVTSNGWVNKDDESKSYIVYPCEGLSAQDIYSTIIRTLSSKGKVNSIPYNSITFTSSIDNAFSSKGEEYGVIYELFIDVKDGKIRINAPRVVKCWLDSRIGPIDTNIKEFDIACGDLSSIFSHYENAINLLISTIIFDLKNANPDW